MKYYFSICAIAKNEAIYLDEWIAYHIIKGVEHFYLRYDDKADDIELARQVLGKWVKHGVVEVEWKETLLQQYPYYSQTHKRASLKSQWVAFIDIDEFIWSDKSMLDYMRKYEKKADAINLEWILFGDNGRKNMENDLVINRFTKHQNILDKCINHAWEFKSIIQSTPAVLDIMKTKNSYPAHLVIKGNIKRLKGNLEIIGSEDEIQFRDYELPYFACNHYYCKSAEEFENKKKKPSVGTGMSVEIRSQCLQNDLGFKNKNDADSHSLAKFSDAVKAKIAEYS